MTTRKPINRGHVTTDSASEFQHIETAECPCEPVVIQIAGQGAIIHRPATQRGHVVRKPLVRKDTPDA